MVDRHGLWSSVILSGLKNEGWGKEDLLIRFRCLEIQSWEGCPLGSGLCSAKEPLSVFGHMALAETLAILEALPLACGLSIAGALLSGHGCMTLANTLAAVHDPTKAFRKPHNRLVTVVDQSVSGCTLCGPTKTSLSPSAASSSV